MGLDLEANLTCVAALYRAGLVEGIRLPTVATWFLSHDVETESMLKLASLDLQPFHSIDAQELFDSALRELNEEETKEALEISVASLCRLFLEGALGVPTLLSIGARLAVENDYPSEPDAVMHFYGLNDEWDAGWGRAREEITAGVRAAAEEAVEAFPEARQADLEVIALVVIGHWDGYMCPVCGYRGLSEQAWVGDSPSDEICWSCGTQFGYDDAVRDLDSRASRHRELRQRWIALGMPWDSATLRPPPKGWDPKAQVARVQTGTD